MTALSRRQFLKASAFSALLATMPNPLMAASRLPLRIPPLMEARRGRPIILTMDERRFNLDGKHFVDVWDINGQYLGPTIKIKSGSFAKLTYHNKLSQNIAISIEGLLNSGEVLGAGAKVLKTNESWSPIIAINQPAATCWYHASTLANSAYQTYRGLLGMWWIDDENSQKSGLPQKYGVNDIPLILQDMSFNGQGVQLYKPNQPYFLGSRLLVNGQEAPYLEAAKGWIRLRILNASLTRVYDLRLDNDQSMLLIARGLGFLPQGIEVQSIDLAPGERIELLLNLNNTDNVSLITGQKRNLVDKISTFFSGDDTLSDNTVLELRTQGEMSAFDNKPNVQFVSDAAEIFNQPIAQERAFYIDVENGTINQKRFDPHRIDVQGNLGKVERWTLTSSAPVGFQIRGVRFVVEQQNGVNTDPSQAVWQDVVLVNGKTSILLKYEYPSSNNYPFLFGASNLMLADMGCLGILVV